MSKTAQRYRSPIRYAEAEIGLDEFETDELKRELRHRAGEDVNETFSCNEGAYLNSELISHITTLLVCGQRESARELVADQLFQALGRRL